MVYPNLSNSFFPFYSIVFSVFYKILRNSDCTLIHIFAYFITLFHFFTLGICYFFVIALLITNMENSAFIFYLLYKYGISVNSLLNDVIENLSIINVKYVYNTRDL